MNLLIENVISSCGYHSLSLDVFILIHGGKEITLLLRRGKCKILLKIGEGCVVGDLFKNDAMLVRKSLT